MTLEKSEFELRVKEDEAERLKTDSKLFRDRFEKLSKELTRLARGRDAKIGRIAERIRKDVEKIAQSNSAGESASAPALLDETKSLSVVALEEEIEEWKAKCSSLSLRLDNAKSKSQKKEKRLERRASVQLMAAETGRKQAEDMLRMQIEGEKERIKHHVEPKVKFAQRKAAEAKRVLLEEKAKLEQEVRELKQELAFEKAEKGDALMEVRFLRCHYTRESPAATRVETNVPSNDASGELAALRTKLAAAEDLLRVLCDQGDGNIESAIARVSKASRGRSEVETGIAESEFAERCSQLENENRLLAEETQRLRSQISSPRASPPRSPKRRNGAQDSALAKKRIGELRKRLDEALSERDGAKRQIATLKRKLMQKIETIRRQSSESSSRILELEKSENRAIQRLKQSVSREESLLAALA